MLLARPKNYQRQDVIVQALNVFWRKGYAATSLSDLMEATGLNKRSIYNEFGNKEQLFAEVLNYYAELRAPIIKLLSHEPLGMHNVIRLLRELANKIDKKGCLVVLSLNERELLSDQAVSMVVQSSIGLQGLIKQNIMADNTCKSTSEQNTLANLIAAQSFSIAGMAKLGQSTKDIKEMTETFVKLLE